MEQHILNSSKWSHRWQLWKGKQNINLGRKIKGNSHCVWLYLILNYPLNFNIGAKLCLSHIMLWKWHKNLNAISAAPSVLKENSKTMPFHSKDYKVCCRMGLSHSLTDRAFELCIKLQVFEPLLTVDEIFSWWTKNLMN